MATPTASFSITVQGLDVSVFDTSANTPTSWLWEWGDGSPDSNTQDATHSYSAEGVYVIRLTSTNLSGNSVVTKEVFVSETPNLGTTIRGFVEMNLPAYISVPDTLITTLIKKWQLQLQHAQPTSVPDANVHNELAWPSLYNIVIAYSVIYDIYLKLAADTLGYSGNSGSGDYSGVGPIKQISVGPSETQFYDPTSAIARLFIKVGNSDSAFDQVLQQVCHTSSILGIKMPMCKRVYNPVIAWVKATYQKESGTSNLGDLLDKYF